MKALLDTNVLLWFVSDDAGLSKEYKNLIENSDNEVWVSNSFVMGNCHKTEYRQIRNGSGF